MPSTSLILICSLIAVSHCQTIGNSTNSTTTSNDEKVVVLNSAAGVPSATAPHQHKYVPVKWYDKFNLVASLQDTVNNFVALSNHPNFGGFQLLNPQNLWEKFHEMGHPLALTGPHGAVFGLAHHKAPIDYPFSARTNRKNK